jgi:tellurite resistance protein TerC
VGGGEAALQFFTAWLVEKSLSLDNIFIIALIFANLKVPPQFQHRVLFWGILGALVLRGVMILVGAEAIRRFSWIIYVFGGLLLLTAVRMLLARHEDVDVDRSLLVRLARRFHPVVAGFRGEHFFVRENGRRAMTPLFVALLAVEGADVVFAVDSIPAAFAVTRDPFLVFTSNVFAILGLRSLFFALAAVLPRFRFLKVSLVVVLGYVGVKMLLAHVYPLPVWISLLVICAVLTVGVLASVIVTRRDRAIRARLGGEAATPAAPSGPRPRGLP